ncbi:MAG: hypothetical protein F6K65_36430, partial [Moorea sp. SIO3C2]|nr:hypothetical protein [Moorena sp. SIO3C2]
MKDFLPLASCLLPLASCLLPLAYSAVWDDINNFVEWASCLFLLLSLSGRRI